MHPMLQESCDEAAACAQIEFDQEQTEQSEPQPECLPLDDQEQAF